MPEGRRLASSPCLADEIAPDGFDPLAVDPEQARDVARWRHAERTRLRASRDALSVADRQAAGVALSAHLRHFLAQQLSGAVGLTLSAYWPIKCEPDLRDLMADLHGRGVTLALPVVELKAAPMVFRRWMPGMAMVRGDWNIPVPSPDAETLTPDIALSPLVGWDGAGFRLGYGGGYFDRTLAALSPRPFTIGIGLQSARLATIFPQPHDIAMDVILTEAGVQFHREGP
ncbi:5-formyltetrahydrofolate cyclo-ligase [Pseudogemmobacter bohemicus]|uniref:5-formyltetrahydrofolate cyclo-ligase n=1 Tax=Pseudogemmobacter bohemicus TaxID=2250708 RepID=UPI000DD365A8|nr:5-formyltetrahydrofolate cyclo-ligase [Pseudogemmobacter bohemicus]